MQKVQHLPVPQICSHRRMHKYRLRVPTRRCIYFRRRKNESSSFIVQLKRGKTTPTSSLRIALTFYRAPLTPSGNAQSTPVPASMTVPRAVWYRATSRSETFFSLFHLRRGSCTVISLFPSYSRIARMARARSDESR